MKDKILTIALPLTGEENEALERLLADTAIKKYGLLRSLVLKELMEKGYLPKDHDGKITEDLWVLLQERNNRRFKKSQ